MKDMKTTVNFLFVCLMGLCAASCTDYQEELDALSYRVTELENLVSQVNSELLTIKKVTDVIADGDYITDLTENDEGYIITFKKHGAVQLKHGATGAAGKDGKDAQAPDITVEQGPDGNWYWKLNGKWLTDNSGNRIRSNAVDGKDGKDGADGKDGKAVAPQVRINNKGSWEISTDGGNTWTDTGTPASGKDGKDGNTVVETITTVTTSAGDSYMQITLYNGQTFTIPIVKA
jgi:hypothetical protein